MTIDTWGLEKMKGKRECLHPMVAPDLRELQPASGPPPLQRRTHTLARERTGPAPPSSDSPAPPPARLPTTVGRN